MTARASMLVVIPPVGYAGLSELIDHGFRYGISLFDDEEWTVFTGGPGGV